MPCAAHAAGERRLADSCGPLLRGPGHELHAAHSAHDDLHVGLVARASSRSVMPVLPPW